MLFFFCSSTEESETRGWHSFDFSSGRPFQLLEITPDVLALLLHPSATVFNSSATNCAGEPRRKTTTEIKHSTKYSECVRGGGGGRARRERRDSIPPAMRYNGQNKTFPHSFAGGARKKSLQLHSYGCACPTVLPSWHTMCRTFGHPLWFNGMFYRFILVLCLCVCTEPNKTAPVEQRIFWETFRWPCISNRSILQALMETSI